MSTIDQGPYVTNDGERLRRAREPLVTPLDIAAYVVALVMVCMPLAFGAFSQ